MIALPTQYKDNISSDVQRIILSDCGAGAEKQEKESEFFPASLQYSLLVSFISNFLNFVHGLSGTKTDHLKSMFWGLHLSSLT